MFDKSGVEIAKEYDTPDWSPDKAQREMEQAITALGKDELAGVYSANDGMAGGAIAALKGAGVDPSRSRSRAATPRWRRSSASSIGEQYCHDLPDDPQAGRGRRPSWQSPQPRARSRRRG